MADMPGLAILTAPPRFYAFFASSMARFFVLSLVSHLLVVLLWPKPVVGPLSQEPITVSLAPQSETQRSPAQLANPPMTLPKGTPAKLAKAGSGQASAKNIPPARLREHETTREGAIKNDPAQPQLAKESPAPAARPPAREEIPERSIIAERERELPTVKQLLPSFSNTSIDSAGSARGRVPLDTKEPQYISYFTSIKRSIDANWKYPELALRYGLQGRLIVEFEILESGALEGPRLVRSSGSALLDEEALRAIRAAAPFAPIPRWIEPKPLQITARMEYHDGRVGRPVR